MSSFLAIGDSGASITLPRWRSLCNRDPSLFLPLGWGFRLVGDVMPTKAVPTPQARVAARRASAARANARAAAPAPIIAEIRASGITTPYAIAAALTARGVLTARGYSFWMAGPVLSLLRRLDRLSAVALWVPKLRAKKARRRASVGFASQQGERHY
jgi:hypothetical protein